MDNFIEELKKEIMYDKQNLEFTKEGQKPLFHIEKTSRILIVGQAPGIKAMKKGKCWDDQSGKRLRDWMGIDENIFYNSGVIGIVPMDFYYPGKGAHGDLPPRKEFAKTWHPKLSALMPNVRLTILVGAYAQKYYLGMRAKRSLTETVKYFNNYLPEYFPIVHPSPLNFGWRKRNPWFEKEAIPILQELVQKAMR